MRTSVRSFSRGAFWRRLLPVLCALAMASCVRVDSQPAFDRWLAADAARAESFARFEAVLQQEGVAGVAPTYQLWRVDQLRRECAMAGFVAPPEQDWANIIATLRILRDQVVPAVGPLEVVSAYRDPEFNTCVQGAPRSAHMSFHALDLVPVERTVTRERLVAALCAIHAREGAGLRMGLGIYAGRRFHVDATGYRGWGADYRWASFPCASGD
jgi:hypothetical protein